MKTSTGARAMHGLEVALVRGLDVPLNDCPVLRSRCLSLLLSTVHLPYILLYSSTADTKRKGCPSTVLVVLNSMSAC